VIIRITSWRHNWYDKLSHLANIISVEHNVACSTVAHVVSSGPLSPGLRWRGPLTWLENLTPLGALVQRTVCHCTGHEFAINNKTGKRRVMARPTPRRFRGASKSRNHIPPGDAQATCLMATWLNWAERSVKLAFVNKRRTTQPYRSRAVGSTLRPFCLWRNYPNRSLGVQVRILLRRRKKSGHVRVT